VMVENRPTQATRSGSPGSGQPLENRPICAASPFHSWEPGRRANARRSGSKSGSGRWSHWDDIGWVHYPEIGWSHSDEIRWVLSHEILQADCDFWDDTEIWSVIGHFGRAVRRFLESGDASGPILEPGPSEYERTRGCSTGEEAKAMDILRLWKLLACLAGNHEDVCREWFLPTALGYLTGYAYTARSSSFATAFSRPNCSDL
jgi:hypothetical protein